MTFEGLDQWARWLAEAMLNGFWQGLIATALAWLVVKAAGRSSAATRYWIWSVTLAAVVGLLFLHLLPAAPVSLPASARPVPFHLASTWPLVLLGGWALGTVVMLARLAWSYCYVRWLARTASPLGAGVYSSREAPCRWPSGC